MILLQTRALGAIRSASLFRNLDLIVERGDRIGLVAANGRGKSTLLQLLAGMAEPDQGEVTAARGLVIGLVPQHVPELLLPLTLRDAVLDALSPDVRETEGWRVDVALDELGAPLVLNDRLLHSLSGGWQRTALLARAWVSEPDLLLMDEPTNHLDLGRIGHLQRWLAGPARGVACVIASHDRAFLDAVTSRTLFLRPEASAGYDLPYVAARAALDEADAATARRHETDLAKAGQLRRQAAKLQNIGINSGSDLLVVKTRQLKERAARIEATARPAHRERSAGAIRLDGKGSHAKALVTLDDATVAAPDGTALFETGRLWIAPGDRVALLGKNGTGKSRLLAALEEAIVTPSRGLRIAPSATVGLSRQDLGQLDAFTSPQDAVTRHAAMDDARARALLAGAGIAVEKQCGPVDRLSGGQRARLALLLLRLARPTLYLLDEPTNHLDIEGQEALEGELARGDAAALIVSHDRAFVRAVGTRFWQIEGQRLRELDGPDAFFDKMMAD
ncbi:ATP-binding cassette domain-containing protein [Pontivivens ytuae]|uniref:ABC-F family ATP-binding cassette domain-containing protein n=1 Tax=Pontivivens ytuae TaxID=2789856 RepID=A0A7S9QCJ0_9RHOB|nr:ATP-binding cassette domain-containing protein [Pontivivens ytuae]QPH53963.1 ABC-F family ATP-binding cassette domain-containing protein [Pontivivens ytuae]